MSVGSTGALIERWLADRKAAGKKSAAHEAARLREYVIPRIGTVPADELRPQQVRAPEFGRARVTPEQTDLVSRGCRDDRQSTRVSEIQRG